MTTMPEGHGIDYASYVMGPSIQTESGVDYRPCIGCICGHGFMGDSWAGVGEMFDEHLAGVSSQGRDT